MMFLSMISISVIIVMSAMAEGNSTTRHDNDVTPSSVTSHRTSVVGSSARFLCEYDGGTTEPTGELVWYHTRRISERSHDGVGLARLRLADNSTTTNGRITITAAGRGLRRSHLLIADVQREDEGTYECDLDETTRAERIDSTTLIRFRLDVHVGVRSVQIKTMTSSESSSHKRVLFRCFSDGNPSPEYTWTNVVDGSVAISGPQYVVNVSCTDQTETSVQLVVRCSARNSVLSKEYLSDANVTVNVRKQKCKVSAVSRRPSFAKSLGVYGATVLSIWTSVGILIFLIRRSDRKRHSLMSKCSPPEQECVYEQVKMNESH